ncbi:MULTISPECIES: outer membrane beta-barrel protein [Tenacibaculum]|uniref:outer membrane beta-barrel protein n=1 Tax=Tenacibaculum TaxID=104267 RepID=UPI001F0B28EE|nr:MULTISPECIES: outer membrane beta-barrel protein [Tenacibaculum]MCH3882312.1 porin family protein [Tenacibaculum aquimarinum]MDO6601022.1 outer membrane beta-barrel protein [Tenacibaculum sp. 1_MG-2023]
MKKILFLATIVLSLNATAQYSSIGIGINGGLPTGNLEDKFSIAFGLDANYLYEVTDQISLGAATGLVYFSGEENNGVSPEDKMYIPIAGSVRFSNDSDSFFMGGDVGYAIGLSPSGDAGGFYFKPIVGYNINESINFNLFYTGIKKEQPTFAYFGLGVMMRL